MVVVSSCRELLGLVPQRAHPLSLVASGSAGDSRETARDNLEEATVFGIFREEAAAQKAADAMKRRYSQTYLAKPVGKLV